MTNTTELRERIRAERIMGTACGVRWANDCESLLAELAAAKALPLKLRRLLEVARIHATRQAALHFSLRRERWLGRADGLAEALDELNRLTTAAAVAAAEKAVPHSPQQQETN